MTNGEIVKNLLISGALLAVLSSSTFAETPNSYDLLKCFQKAVDEVIVDIKESGVELHCDDMTNREFNAYFNEFTVNRDGKNLSFSRKAMAQTPIIAFTRWTDTITPACFRKPVTNRGFIGDFIVRNVFYQDKEIVAEAVEMVLADSEYESKLDIKLSEFDFSYCEK